PGSRRPARPGGGIRRLFRFRRPVFRAVTDPGLLEWARLPGPAKVLEATRRRLEAGHGMAGRPLRVSLTSAERDQVGRLLGTSWVLSGRQVGAKALAEAVASLGTDLETLLTS